MLIHKGRKPREIGWSRYRREYSSYSEAKYRCENPHNISYPNYGGRGVEFRFKSFEQFFKCIGTRPFGTSIDRIDSSGHYEPNNVRWSTRKEQSRNKRNNHRITINEETKTLADWREAGGYHHTTVIQRLRKGFCNACAVFNKPHAKCNHATN